MRKYKRKRKNQNKIILIGMFSLLLFFSIGYAAFQTNITLTAKGNIKDKSRVIQSWSHDATTDFHDEAYKANIINITFLDSSFVPNNAIESWDVSQTKDKGVMAYVTANTDDNTKYDLFVGAKNGVIANENSGNLFYDFQDVESINFNGNFDTSNVINMDSMFANCRELLVLDLSSFDTGNVINMRNMFVSGVISKPMKLETIIFGENFITNNVTNMRAMFGNCNYLTNLDVSGFNTSNVTDMHDMFASCHSLTFLNLANWNTSKVTDMHGMFFACKSLTTLDLCSFDTVNVKDMNSMFYSCHNLTELNLCSFDTRKVATSGSMFGDTPKLNNVYVGPNWTIEPTTENNLFGSSNISQVTTGMCDQIIN